MCIPILSIVVATDAQRGIGLNGTIPWQLKKDMAFFKELTTTNSIFDVENKFGISVSTSKPPQALSKSAPSPENAVIMGRKTWESIPRKFRPLPNRLNIILTRNTDFIARNAVVDSRFEHAVKTAMEEGRNNIFIIGGSEIYNQALQTGMCSQIYLTQIQQTIHCDTFFPALPDGFKKAASSPQHKEGPLTFTFDKYIRPGISQS